MTPHRAETFELDVLAGYAANHEHDPGQGITYITRGNDTRPVAAVVPAAIARHALDYEAMPHTPEAWRLADQINMWRATHTGRALATLPPTELGKAAAYRVALAAVTQATFGGSGEQYEGDFTEIAEALDCAQKIAASCTAWSQARATP